MVFGLASCRTSQPTGPVTEPTTAAPPTQAVVPTDTPAPSVVPSPSPTVQVEEGSTEDGRPLAARVNGQPVYLDVYDKQVAQTLEALTQQGLILEGEEGKAQIVQIQQNVLNGLIEQVLIEQAAADAGIRVTDEEVDTTIQQSVDLGQGQESFDQWLAENDMTMEEFRDIQRSQLLASKMIDQITAQVPTTAEQVHARHIRTSELGQAQALLDELKGGANFAALAQRTSEDVSTAANGGDLGWFPRDVPLMPPVVVETAFALGPGQISEVVESDQGYHIIKVEAREANRPLGPDILLYVRQRAFEEWLDQQRDRAAIERYVDQVEGKDLRGGRA